MPEIRIEMHSNPGTRRVYTTSRRGGEEEQWTSNAASTRSPQSGTEFSFPQWSSGGNSNQANPFDTFQQFFGSSSSTDPLPDAFRQFFGPSTPSAPPHDAFRQSPGTPTSNDPPSYKQAVYGENDVGDPLLSNKPGPSAPPPKEFQSNTRKDVSSLVVEYPEENEQDDGDSFKDTCVVLCCRVFVVLGILFGILLLYWEKQYQASIGPASESNWKARRQFHLREGFGWTLIVLAVLLYFADGYAMCAQLAEWNSKDLLGHLDKVKGGTPRLTWYMTTFNPDVSTRVVTDSDGSMRTERRNDRITTWSGTKEFHFSKWADVTPDQMDNLGSVNKISFYSKFILAEDGTQRVYEAQKQAFIDANKHKGQDYSIKEIFEIEGFEKKMQVTGPNSCLANLCTLCLVFFTFGCYYPWVCCVSGSHRRVAYTHIKELSF